MPARIAICLFEDYLDRFEANAMMIGKNYQPVQIKVDVNQQINLFARRSENSQPDWVEVVKGFGEVSSLDLSSASSGAVLFVQIQKRVIACCFGSSVSCINRNSIVNDFGLAVAYHRIARKNIKRIESHTLSTNPITNTRSSSFPTTKDNFNLDAYLENITELGGLIASKSRAYLIRGKEFFSTPSPLSLSEIIDLCENLLSDYLKTSEDEDFRRLTSTRKIKDRKLISTLDNDLCKRLSVQNPDVSLVDYEEFSDLITYRISAKGPALSSLSIADLQQIVRKSPSAEYLKDKKITATDSQGENYSWSLYKCLFCELSYPRAKFILYKGYWYELQEAYLGDLRAFIKAHEIDVCPKILPQWNGNDDESVYNINASKVANGQCWDKRLYNHVDYRYGIEFCDILTDQYIIHVKKYGSSSLSSHLLLQTLVSARLFLSDIGLKAWIGSESKSMFKKNILMTSRGKQRNRNVEYLIVLMKNSDGKLHESLPFFSLITFNLIIRKITQFGFRVSVGVV